MRLELNGKINTLYVQSLCMMFFRGEKFPLEGENPRATARVTLEELENGVFCKASVTYDGKTQDAEHFEPYTEKEAKERTSKTATGHAVFNACSRLLNYRPVWGLLTGIRPSSVAAELIKGYGEDGALEMLQNKYLLSYDKARLAIDTAKNENSIIEKFGDDTCSVYISIPFCPTRCAYCSFISYATKKLFELMPGYVERIVSEIKETFTLIDDLGLKIASIYVGGGTPTTLDVSQLEIILSTVKDCLKGREVEEFTVEGGRPDTITEEKLKVLKKHGVDRISVNPQTLNDSVLVKIGRRHTVKDFFDAYEMVKCEDFEVVNTDLIAGLDGDSFESFVNTVDKIVELSPENVTVHTFSVKKSASVRSEDEDIYNKELSFAVNSVDYAYKRLTSCGYVPYYMYRQKNTVCDLENVGYAKPGTFGAYNVLMMADGHTVFGIGAGATTKLVRRSFGKKEILRIFSPKYPYEYLQDNKNKREQILSFLTGGKTDENN